MRRCFAPLLLAAFAAQAWVVSRRTGLTYDEPPHIAAGFVYWTVGLGLFTREHPPLTDYLRGLALLPLGAVLPEPLLGQEARSHSPHEFGQLFLFGNRVPAQTLLYAARDVTLLLSLLLALTLWRWGGLAALFFFAFEPNLLAHGTLATTDMGAAAFMTLALASWAVYLQNKDRKLLGLAGAAAGAAVCSKATGLGLLPAMALSLFWTRKRLSKTDAADLLALGAIAALIILLVYRPAGLDRFFEMIAYRSAQMRSPTPIFLFGRPYHQGHPLYFPALLLLKTSLPLLALTVLALWKRENTAGRRVALSALAVVLGAALIGRRQLGVRYVLPVFPLFCYLAGTAAEALWKKGLRTPVFLACLWHAASALWTFPFPLAYFNELAGGPGNAYRVSGESNVDWGSTVPELKRFIAGNPGGLILSYFGTDCPREHGLVFQEAFCSPGACPGTTTLLPLDAGKEWLAVSATKWQGYQEQGPPSWGWLWSRKPHAVLGYAMLVYDITRDAQAHRQLAAMYERAGQGAAAIRERKRAALISAQ